MRVATWNVNSIRARLPRLLAWLDSQEPDVVCLQETKVVAEGFPVEALRAAGYESCVVGQKTYNGVAILAKRPPRDVVAGFADGEEEAEARLVSATVEGVRVICAYVPNGKEVGSEKYAYKLEWLERLGRFLARQDPSAPLVLVGDFNVAPEDRDVHDPAAWEGRILCSEPERAALRRALGTRLVDAFRHLHPDAVQFTWWDYRQLAFPRNQGLRIDHIYVSRDLVDRLVEVTVDRDERKGKGASDHAPVLARVRARPAGASATANAG